VEFSYGGTLTNPKTRAMVAASRLEAREVDRICSVCSGDTCSGRRHAREYFRVQRGVATGANEFFIMSGEQALERGIPRQWLRAILPGRGSCNWMRCRRMRQEIRNWRGRCGCSIAACPSRKSASSTGPVALPCGWQSTGCRRLPVQQARAVVCTEIRAPTFFLCTYIARGRRDGRLQRFIFNRSQAIATNSYLMLYRARRSSASSAAMRARPIVWSC